MKLLLPTTFPAPIVSKLNQIAHLSQHQSHKSASLALIGSFLSMEEDGLSPYQIKKVMEGKSVRLSEGAKKEVNNVIHVCQYLPTTNSISITDFKKTHALLMSGIDKHGGQWRNENVAVFEGKKIAYLPPQSSRVPKLMQKIFHYVKAHPEIPWALRACVFHYGIQFIHPFSNGNGRIGRIWQHRLLLEESPIFQRILIGQIIKDHARAYYQALDKSDKASDINIFIEFCLNKMLAEMRKRGR